jgi:hypothetical protein
MEERLAHSRQAFHLGLLLILAPAILSAVVDRGWGLGLVLVMLLGGLVALAARFWHRRLLNAARNAGGQFGYPFPLSGQTRFHN